MVRGGGYVAMIVTYDALRMLGPPKSKDYLNALNPRP